MGLRYPDQHTGFCFFITTTFADWRRYGDMPGIYEALADSLVHYTSVYSARIAGYVLMPSHLHLVVFIDGGRLGNYVRDFKKYTSQKSLPDLGVIESPIWMRRYDRVLVETEKVLRVKLEYIHQNPVKAYLASRPEDWRWSSAGDYLSGRAGAVEIWKGWA